MKNSDDVYFNSTRKLKQNNSGHKLNLLKNKFEGNIPDDKIAIR